MTEDGVIIQHNIEHKYVLEVSHMKSGSNIVLCIKKLRVSGDDLDTVMSELKDALADYLLMAKE